MERKASNFTSATWSGDDTEHDDTLNRLESVEDRVSEEHQMNSSTDRLDCMESQVPPQTQEPTLPEQDAGTKPPRRSHSFLVLQEFLFERVFEPTRMSHGGDWPVRLERGARSALASSAFFSILVFPSGLEDIFGAIWIGNIFMHLCLQDSLGSCLQKFVGLVHSLLLTTALSVPIAMGLHSLDDRTGQIVLPFLSFAVSFLLMSCPWLVYRNVMILVFYVAVAPSVREDPEWHYPLGYCGSYLVGLAIAVLANLLPIPNSAILMLRNHLKEYKDFVSLFWESVQSYTCNAGEDIELARAAVSGIELMVGRLRTKAKEIKSLAPAAIEEMSWTRAEKTDAYVAFLNAWTNHIDKQTTHLVAMQTALQQRYLGEALPTQDVYARKARRIIAQGVGYSYRKLLENLLETNAYCVDLLSCGARSFAPTKQDAIHHTRQLRMYLTETQNAFSRAVHQAVQAADHFDSSVAKPEFAHLARRMASFHSLFLITEDLITFLEINIIMKPDEIVDETGADTRRKTRLSLPLSARKVVPMAQRMLRPFSKTLYETYWKPKWLWRTKEGRRLAFKTATGMILASLFISVDWLYKVSEPFGIWPGLTVASVNLATTGSSFHKAVDRLFGTLLAAAYALLVTDFLPGDRDAVKVPAIGFFTFLVIYMQEPEHAYRYSYAATSVGSMLYGSLSKEVTVENYIPARIELIFVGVLIFAGVELFIFPRSSRRIAEREAYSFFFKIRDLLENTVAFVGELEDFMNPETEQDLIISDSQSQSSVVLDTNGAVRANEDRDTHLGRLSDSESSRPPLDNAVASIGTTQGNDIDLNKRLGDLKSTTGTLQTQVSSALKEPYFGFSHRLAAGPITNFANEAKSCQRQARLLVETVSDWELGLSRRKSFILELRLNWPSIYRSMLEKVLHAVNKFCQKMEDVYLDGRIRPQNHNSIIAIRAAAAFRDFDSIRLELISVWSQCFYDICKTRDLVQKESNEIMMLGISISVLLELCRHFQKAGKAIEQYARTFP